MYQCQCESIVMNAMYSIVLQRHKLPLLIADIIVTIIYMSYICTHKLFLHIIECLLQKLFSGENCGLNDPFIIGADS